jgi:hypothetical protein
MTNRVLLGKFGTKYGLWVSKPGVNLLKASEDEMLLSTERQSFQIVKSGVISFPGAGDDAPAITIPNLGFNPLVLLSCPSHFVGYRMASLTSLVIRGFSVRNSRISTTPITYAVTNQPLYH